MTEEEYLTGLIRKNKLMQSIDLAEKTVAEGNKFRSLEKDYNCYRNRDEKFHRHYGF